MKFRFIRDGAAWFRVGRMCRVLNVSRSGYYAWLRRPESRRAREDRRLAAQIRAIHKQYREVYGSPRVHAELRAQKIRCSRKRVARLMRQHGIRAKQTKRFRPGTTDAKHFRPVAPNVLNRNFNPRQANTAWAADLSYIPTRQGWLYLAVVMDLFSRRVVGWAAGQDLSRDLSVRALQMALGRRRPQPGLIHHSDRGSQYTSDEYQAILTQHGMVCSMSRLGDCYDNAVVESFFHTLKVEQIEHEDYPTRREATADIFEYIEVFYNRQRRHSHLGQVSPAAFEEATRGQHCA